MGLTKLDGATRLGQPERLQMLAAIEPEQMLTLKLTYGDLWRSPECEGWRNKPHRYLYDALVECAALRAQADALRAELVEANAHADGLSAVCDECKARAEGAWAGPVLSDAPLPEGREGQTLFAMRPIGRAWDVCIFEPYEACGEHPSGWGDGEQAIPAGAEGWRWAWVTR